MEKIFTFIAIFFRDPLILNLTREGVVDRAKLLEKILGCSKVLPPKNLKMPN